VRLAGLAAPYPSSAPPASEDVRTVGEARSTLPTRPAADSRLAEVLRFPVMTPSASAQ
jgi:hypothetical protein